MKTYTISQVSEMFQLPTSTLRYYEEMGILSNVGRSPSGQRIYNSGHIDRLGNIRCFKRTGMSIAKLQEFYQYEEDKLAHTDDILRLLQDQKDQVAEQLLQLQIDFEHVQRKLDYYSGIKNALDHQQPVPGWELYKDKRYPALANIDEADF